jgi:hypothetical protein
LKESCAASTGSRIEANVDGSRANNG